MPEEFDPYSQWLGIFAHERPIDHYRLLGIARFSSDPAQIAAAADKRMALIRSYQTGPRGRLTQSLLNEIAAAKICLLNPSAKEAYDAMLEGLAAAIEPPPVAGAPSLTPPPPPPTDYPVLTVETIPAEASADEHEDALSTTDEPLGRPAGLIVVALSVLVILGVVGIVTWQVITSRQQGNVRDRLGNVVAEKTRQDDPQGTPSDHVQTATGQPTVVYQESDGSVNFTPSVAVLSGTSLHLQTIGITDTLSGWTSVDDVAAWKCKVVKLPPNGVFRVLVTYRASIEANAGSFQIAINGREKRCEIRGNGAFVTDEYFLAVTRSGEQTLELKSTTIPGGTFELKGVRLVMTSGEVDAS